FHQYAATSHVDRLIFIDQRTVHGVAVLLQDGGGFGRWIAHRLKHDGWTKGNRITKDVFDGLIARHHPVTDLGAIEDRLLFARPSDKLRWVLHVGVLKRIEFGGLVIKRAPRCLTQGSTPVLKRTAGRLTVALDIEGHLCSPIDAVRHITRLIPRTLHL